MIEEFDALIEKAKIQEKEEFLKECVNLIELRADSLIWKVIDTFSLVHSCLLDEKNLFLVTSMLGIHNKEKVMEMERLERTMIADKIKGIAKKIDYDDFHYDQLFKPHIKGKKDRLKYTVNDESAKGYIYIDEEERKKVLDEIMDIFCFCVDYDLELSNDEEKTVVFKKTLELYDHPYVKEFAITGMLGQTVVKGIKGDYEELKIYVREWFNKKDRGIRINECLFEHVHLMNEEQRKEVIFQEKTLLLKKLNMMLDSGMLESEKLEQMKEKYIQIKNAE